MAVYTEVTDEALASFLDDYDIGIAIGAAWGGLLSNFAAGAFILVLRPFKVGDYVLAADVEGTVRAIGLFTTAIDTPDNVNTMVGNAKVMTNG